MSKEFVKERVLKYLMEDLLVPQDMIDTNVPLSEFEEGAEGVLDIIVNVVVKEDGKEKQIKDSDIEKNTEKITTFQF